MVFVFQLCALVGVRCVFRLCSTLGWSYIKHKPGEERIMMIGAGESGRMLARELRTSSYAKGKLVCVINDNSQLRGKYLDGVRIVGRRERIEAAARNIG